MDKINELLAILMNLQEIQGQMAAMNLMKRFIKRLERTMEFGELPK